MPYDIARSDDEIDAVRNRVSEQENAGGSAWPGMTYEQGVEAALAWVTGEQDTNPMED